MHPLLFFFLFSFFIFFSFILGVIYIPQSIPYRWEVRLFLLMGMPVGQFLNLLIQNGVDPVFWHRALYGLYVSLINSLFWIPKETIEYPDLDTQTVEMKQDPIFLLGHYRSGTSLLHELMSKDVRFIAPTLFQCYTPRVFLWREDYMYHRFKHIKINRCRRGGLSYTNSITSSSPALNTPFEDEIAITNICGLSPYMGHIFPKRRDYYERFLTFKQCSDEEIDLWKKSFVWFLKRILFRYQENNIMKNHEKRLLLKSPSHTGRIKLLLELFPNAKFIHVHRNPFEIYPSTLKLHEKLLIQWCLQRPDFMKNNNDSTKNIDEVNRKFYRKMKRHDIDYNYKKDNIQREIILNHFQTMYDSYFEDRKLIPEGNLVEIEFNDLISSPTQVIKKIYKDLNLQGWNECLRDTINIFDRQGGSKKRSKQY